MNRRHTTLWLLLCMLVALPLAADEMPADHLKKLKAADEKVRLEAVAKLRKMGEAAREALEGYIDPGGAEKKPAVEVTEELKKKVEALISQLDSAKFKEREGATKALLKIGKPATEQLKAAAKVGPPEVASRAKGILSKLYPPPPSKTEGQAALIEAAMLLGDIGNRKSIPALQSVLNSEKSSAMLAEAAAYALRSITGGGPSLEVLDWKKNRTKALESWKAHLAKAAPTGEAVELSLKYAKGTVLSFTEKTNFVARMKMDKVDPNMPAGMADAKFEGIVNGKYKLTVAETKPLTLVRKFSKHKQEMKGMAGMGGDEATSWDGKTLKITWGDDHVAKATLDDVDVKNSDMKGPLALGHVLALNLPAGKYAVGERKTLSRPALLRMATLVFLTTSGKKELLDGAGNVRYVGRVGGADRYFLSSKAVMAEGRTGINVTLQGTVDIDPKTGLMTKHSLFGMLWQVMNMGTSGGTMFGEMRLGSFPQKATSEKTDTPKEKSGDK